MLNILTIDLEDYFQVHAFSGVIRYEDWDKFECRIERNTDRLLEILNAATHNSTFKTQTSKFNIQNSNLDHSIAQHSVLSPQHSITHSLNNSLTRKVQATFFVLGWIAERYPGLVRRIQKQGHEIACHGYAHQLVYTQSRAEFRQDIKRAKSILEDITGSEVIGYRAPSYSITNKSQWAFEVLVEEGFKYDSSIFPIRHDFYGMPDAPRFPFVISLNSASKFEFSMLSCESKTTQNSKLKPQNLRVEINNSLTQSLINSIPNNSKPRSSVLEVNSLTHSLINSRALIEFPLSTVKVLGQNVPISGGGYFRLLPYPLIKKGLKTINEIEEKPFIFYLHPWELDFEQPRIKEVGLKSRFRHYVNLNKTEEKFGRLLKDFDFSSVKQMLQLNNSLTY
jgi:hypothetical protein